MPLSPDELTALSPQQRGELLRALVLLEGPGLQPTPRLLRRRRLFLRGVLTVTTMLAVWIVALAITLPQQEIAGHWRGAWVGFDVFELTGFLVTGWAASRRRQLLIPAALVTGTLLFCDAWFDVVLSWNTRTLLASLASALLVEIPLGVLLWGVARRLVRQTLASTRARLGLDGDVPPLHQMALTDPIGG